MRLDFIVNPPSNVNWNRVGALLSILCALAARRGGTTLEGFARALGFVSASSGEELAEVVGELGITVAVGIVMDRMPGALHAIGSPC